MLSKIRTYVIIVRIIRTSNLTRDEITKHGSGRANEHVMEEPLISTRPANTRLRIVDV